MTPYQITRVSNKTTGGTINVNKLAPPPAENLSIGENHHNSPKWEIGSASNPTELELGYDDPGSTQVLVKLWMDGDELNASYSAPISKKENPATISRVSV